MRQRLQEEASRLDGLLARFGIEVDGGTSLFRHITMTDAAALFETLGNRAILLRNFAERPTELRIGLPGAEEEWRRLEDALARSAQRQGRAQQAGLSR